MTTFDKKYDFSQDDKIYVNWEKDWDFKENPEAKNWNFCIPLPPPNVTGVLHIGHAQMLAIEDIMVRYNRMSWKKTLRIPWTDHAWISTQVVVEKKLKTEKWISRHDLWRVRFLEEVWKFVKESRSQIIKQSKKMWASLDWDREQFTLSERNFRAVRQIFKKLYKNWKIYKDIYMTNRCPRCQTVLSDLEVNMVEEKWKLVYIKYFLTWKWDSITVATTRPETMFADVAVAVNPNDKRYKKYIGKTVQIPIINREIPVISDHDVDMSFWTAALKITPTHDKTDFDIAQRHELSMDFFAIDKDWKLTELAWNFAWLDAEESVDIIIEHLENIWNLEKVEDYTHNVPRCDRCKTLVQPMVSKQWFVDVQQACTESMKAIHQKEINVVPSRFEKTFEQWFDKIQPWCISRQLRWGHRIPVRTCECWHVNVFDEDDILERYKTESEYKWNPWLDAIVFNLIADSKLENDFNIETLIELLYQDSLVKSQWKTYQSYIESYILKAKEIWNFEKDIEVLQEVLDSVKSQDVDLIMKSWEILSSFLEKSLFLKPNDDTFVFELKCQKCWSTKLEQESDTLDTWFSSWLRAYTVLGWPENTPDLQNFYPNTVLETWHDIIFFRVARMMFMSFYAFWKEDDFSWVPFKNVYFHWLVRDGKWQKMSKSKWNWVDPLDKIEQSWADALRLSLVLGTTPWNDMNFSEDKLDYNKRFINKLWNASRFVHLKCEIEENDKLVYEELYKLLSENKDNLTNFDKWILSQLDELVVELSESMENFNFWESFANIQKFVWNRFCDWYVEVSKYDDWPFTPTVLLYSLGTIYKLLHPIIPFVTERLWWKMWFEWKIISSNSPNILKITKSSAIDQLVEIIISLRNIRHKNAVKPHLKVDIFIENFLNSNLKSYEEIIKNIVWSERIIEVEDSAIVDIVWDFKIWIILPEQEQDFAQKVQELEKQLEDEEWFLQWIRKLLASEWFRQNASADVVKMKEDKKLEVEDRIFKLKQEISKIKLKLK